MIDVTDATFEAEVVERSKDVPVVVDLWASWCGPCRQLGPILEEVIGATDGKVVLAKVDVDANPQVAASFNVRGIPAVYGLRGGRVIDGFVGAQGRDEVSRFVEGLMPSAKEGEIAELIQQGDVASLRLALELDPGNVEVILALAKQFIADERPDEALELLAKIPPSTESRHLEALARTGEVDVDSEDVDGRVVALLERIPGDDEARTELLDLLELLGPDDPRTAGYRKALTLKLF